MLGQWIAGRLFGAALALYAGAAPPAHQFQGWGPAALPLGVELYSATIEIPAQAPAGTEYSWVMAQAPGVTGPFTQIGLAWFAPGTSGYVGPVLFAYTVPPGGKLGANDWVFGEQLSPGASVSVRIERDGTTYNDQVYWQGAWATLDSGTISARPLWSTKDETYGPLFRVCFAGRSYEVGRRVVAEPAGCFA